MTNNKETLEETTEQGNEVESLLATPYEGVHRREALSDEPEEVEEDPAQIPSDEDVPEEELDAEEKTFKKRYADLRRYTHEKEASLQEEIEALRKQVEEATPQWTPPKSVEDLEAFAKENPEAYDILVSIADQRAQDRFQEVNKLRTELEETKRQSAEQAARDYLVNHHPDWDDIRSSDEFHEWAAEQPEPIQDGIYKNASDGKLAARIIDMYKFDTGMSQKDNKKTSGKSAKAAAAELAHAAGKKTEVDKPLPTFKRSEIQSMSIREYEEREAEILAAQRDGRIIDD